MPGFESAGNISGPWECPDLFKLPVDNDPNKMKWVLVHSVSPSAQYFIGNFNGNHFTWESLSSNGILIDDFESGNYSNWTTTGTSFGSSPTNGTGIFLDIWVTNSSILFDGNGSQGKLVSSNFTIQKNYISFLIGGGYHPNGTYIKARCEWTSCKNINRHE